MCRVCSLGATICYRVSQIFIGLCNFRTELQILRVTIEIPGFTHTVGAGVVCHTVAVLESSFYLQMSSEDVKSVFTKYIMTAETMF